MILLAYGSYGRQTVLDQLGKGLVLFASLRYSPVVNCSYPHVFPFAVGRRKVLIVGGSCHSGWLWGISQKCPAWGFALL